MSVLNIFKNKSGPDFSTVIVSYEIKKMMLIFRIEECLNDN